MPDPPATPHRRYRAPQDNGVALVEPGWGEAKQLINSNRDARVASRLELQGGRLADLSAEARRELIAAAYDFTRQFCDVPAPPADPVEGPLLLSGHQPELFHPGVWFKNLALDALAKRVGGVGVQLLIDGDLCRKATVRAPAGPAEAPRVVSIAYDQPADAVPHEERAVLDPPLLESFGGRVAEALDGLIDEPLAPTMAGDMAAAAGRTGNLGLALSAARRRVEARWHSKTIELPFSRVCDTTTFRRFLLSLLAAPEHLRDAYNASLAAYRAAHRLRSPAQPLPDLTSADGWTETPFWVWSTGDPTRRPLFARARGAQLMLTNRAGEEWSVPSPGGSWEEGAAKLDELRLTGVKIRSRALVTTLYSRLVLGDLFLHGIGGAKYDEVTDGLAHRLFGAAPPPHMTMTATLRLPIDYPAADPSEDARLLNELRELRYHPERFADRGHPDAGRLIGAKRAALAAPVELGRSNAARHRRIERANEALQPLVAARREALLAERETLAARLHATTALGSREYSFCLFPERYLHEQMSRMTAGAGSD